jgi:hypothetical protein
VYKRQGYGWRWVKPIDLAAFAGALGLSLDWEKAL